MYVCISIYVVYSIGTRGLPILRALERLEVLCRALAKRSRDDDSEEQQEASLLGVRSKASESEHASPM